MNQHQLDFEHFLSRALAAAGLGKAYSCAFFLEQAQYEATLLGWDAYRPRFQSVAQKCRKVLGYE